MKRSNQYPRFQECDARFQKGPFSWKKRGPWDRFARFGNGPFESLGATRRTLTPGEASAGSAIALDSSCDRLRDGTSSGFLDFSLAQSQGLAMSRLHLFYNAPGACSLVQSLVMRSLSHRREGGRS